MKNKKKKANLFLFAILLTAGFFGFWEYVFAASPTIIINEIQISGGTGKTTQEFIELYNFGDTPIDLSMLPLKLHIVNSTSNQDTSKTLTYANKIIQPAGYFLIASADYTKEIPDATYYSSSNSLVSDGAVYISTSATKDVSVISFVCWGSSKNCNLSLANPQSGYTLEKNAADNWQESYILGGTPGYENFTGDDKEIEYSDQIIINELLPHPSTGDEEFIELYNLGAKEESLDGWKLKDKSGNICNISDKKIKTNEYLAIKESNFSSGCNISLNDTSGEIISLYNPRDEAPVSTAEYSETAKINFSYSFDGTNWRWTSLPTPGSENKFAEDIDYPDKLFISELLPDPSDSPEKDFEYVEIFNSEEENVDLSGWKLKDESSSYTLAGMVGPKGFIIFYDTVSLNNGGDEIKLVDPLDKVVHAVSYEEAKENYSYSWKWTSFLTPGSKNIFDEDIEYPKELYLSEILPNPEDEEEKKEFIEIYNPLDKDVDLGKWVLKDSGKTTKYVFPQSSEIGKKKYLVIYREDFKFALNNSGDEKVYLLNPNEEIVSSVSYSDSNEGVSYNFDGKKWRWSKSLTPGKENKFNKLPKIEVDIDDKVYIDVYADFKVKVNDPEKEEVKVTWDFGDGHKSYKKETRHKYEKKGKYKLSVKIFDGSEEVIKEYKIEVKKFPHREVKIRALCPNPAGNDSENEWILVKNYSDDEINLKGWSVATGSEKLYNHPIYEDIKIKKGKTGKITREDSSFTLNNEKSKVELRYPDGKEAYEVKYDKGDDNTAEEDEIYEKTDGGWQWTKALTNPVKSAEADHGAGTNEARIGVEEIEEENFEEFMGGQSVIAGKDNKMKELINYGVKIKLADYDVSSNPRVLGISTEKQKNSIYQFTETRQTEHYAVKFFKNLLSAINYSINKLISSFY